MGMFEQLYVKHIGKSESTKLPSQLELTEEDGKLLHEMRIVL